MKPIVAGGCVLFANKAGAVSCVARETGEVLWKHRLADHSWASPIRSGDRVYYFTKEGVTSVLRPDREGPHPLAENDLTVGGTVYGVAALEGAFLLRTGGELIKVVGSTRTARGQAGSENVVGQNGYGSLARGE